MSDYTSTVLADAEMRVAGFTDRRPEAWYLCRSLYPGVTFNVTIDKESGVVEELVMDEDFGQPFFYGNSSPAVRDEIVRKIDAITAELISKGLSVWVDHAEYGCEEAQ